MTNKKGTEITIRAQSALIRQSTRKVKLVAEAVKNIQHPEEVVNQLKFTSKRAAEALLKTVKQAIANAVNNYKIPNNQLIMNKIQVDAGPTMKRFRIGGRGRIKPVLKRTCRITVILEKKEEKKHG